MKLQDILTDINELKGQYLTDFKQMDSETRISKLNLINKKHEKCKQLSEEKVQLASQTYELVDKHIRKLDIDMAHFEAELKDKLSHRRSGGDSVDSHSFVDSTLASLHNVNPDKKKKKKQDQQSIAM